ncbi:MAG: GtrA family protein [Myxococcales bacterium]|nr:MAG: GtrA family protein [Myxococcales bacterium]
MLAKLQKTLREQGVRSVVMELVRFGGVGGLTTLLYFLLLWGLDKLLSLPMWAIAALASGPPLLVAYLLHRSFTFNSEQQHTRAGPRFVVVQLLGVVINSAVIWVGTDVFKLPFLLAQLAAIGIQVMATYLGQKFFAFA